MKNLYTDITFDPTAKTVQFNNGVSSLGGNPPIFPTGKVLLIINATRGVVYYNFASSTAKATFSSSGQHWVATLTDANTTGHNSADSIIAYYDDATSTQTIKGDVFASIQNPLVAELSAVGANGFDSDKTFLIDLTKYSGSTFGLLVGGGGPFSFTIHNGTSSNPPTVVTNPITGDKYTTVPATNGWHVFRVDGNASGGPSLNLTIKKVSGTANPGTQQTFRFFALQNPSDISAITPVAVRTKSWVTGDVIASGSAGGTGNTNLSYPPQAGSISGALVLPPNCDGFAFELIGGGGTNTFTFEWGSYSANNSPTGPDVISAVPAIWETPSGDSGTSVNNVYGQKFYFRIPSPKLLGGIYSPRFRAIKGASDSGSCNYAFYPIQLNPLPQGAATAANQATANTSLGATTEPAATADNANSGLVGLFKRLLQRISILLNLVDWQNENSVRAQVYSGLQNFAEDPGGFSLPVGTVPAIQDGAGSTFGVDRPFPVEGNPNNYPGITGGGPVPVTTDGRHAGCPATVLVTGFPQFSGAEKFNGYYHLIKLRNTASASPGEPIIRYRNLASIAMDEFVPELVLLCISKIPSNFQWQFREEENACISQSFSPPISTTTFPSPFNQTWIQTDGTIWDGLNISSVNVSPAALPVPIASNALGSPSDLMATEDAFSTDMTGFSISSMFKRLLWRMTTLLARIPTLTLSGTRLTVDGSGVTQPARIVDSNGANINYISSGTAGNPASTILTVQGISGATPVSTSSAGAAGPATVTTFSSTTNGEIRASNPSRKMLSIFNEGPGNLCVLYGDGSASTSNYSVRLLSGDYLEIDKYTGRVMGIFESSGTARATEIS